MSFQGGTERKDMYFRRWKDRRTRKAREKKKVGKI